MFNVSFILLHISTVLTLTLFVVVLRMKNKKGLHYQALGLVLVIFLWCFFSLMEQYANKYLNYHGMLLINLMFSAVSFLPVFLFTFGVSYAYPDSALKSKFYILLVVPIAGVILIWTNSYHHLYFVNYSQINSNFDKGVWFIVQTIFTYILDFLGLFFLIKASIKNSAFFSKQSLLILIGALCPFVVDMAFVFNVFSFPLYYEPISFTIAVVCSFVAIFRFDLLNIVPIALQTIVDHISDSYIVINENNNLIDYNKPFF